MAQSVSYSLEDIQWIGDDPEILDKSRLLQGKLNELINDKTCVIDVPEHLKQDFRFESFLGVKSGNEGRFELRKDASGSKIFVCAIDHRDMVSEFCSFDSIDSLEEVIWES